MDLFQSVGQLIWWWYDMIYLEDSEQSHMHQIHDFNRPWKKEHSNRNKHWGVRAELLYVTLKKRAQNCKYNRQGYQQQTTTTTPTADDNNSRPTHQKIQHCNSKRTNTTVEKLEELGRQQALQVKREYNTLCMIHKTLQVRERSEANEKRRRRDSIKIKERIEVEENVSGNQGKSGASQEQF